VPGALDDLAARRLRVLHDASFADDPTRLLRMVRYAARLGFTVEPGTRALAEAAVSGDALATVSGARIGSELRPLLDHPETVAALGLLADLGIDRALGPGLRADPALTARALALLPAEGRRDLLALGAAARETAPEPLQAWLTRLALPVADATTVVATAAASELAERLAELRSGAAIGALLSGAPPEPVALAGALGAESAARRWLEELQHVRLSIGGADLVAAGVPEGPRVGRGLRAALAARLDGAPPDRDAELATALAVARADETSEH
jgi:tRNA nucleotidyltransferase (CCA-adding enzyme)